MLSGVRAIIFGTSIETLIQCGWFQIRISFDGGGLHSRPSVYMFHKTDLLYRMKWRTKNESKTRCA